METNLDTKSNIYTGDGANDQFDYPFVTTVDTQVTGWLKSATGAVSQVSNFSINAGSHDNIGGGTVTYPNDGSAKLASTERFILTRSLPLTQNTDYVNQERYSASNIEGGLDKNARLVQQINEISLRSLRFSQFESGYNTELPTPSADKLLATNLANDGFQWVSTMAGVIDIGDLDASTGVQYDHLEHNGTAWAAQANMNLSGDLVLHKDNGKITLNQSSSAYDSTFYMSSQYLMVEGHLGIQFGVASSYKLLMTASTLRPVTANTMSLGSASYQFNQAFVKSGVFIGQAGNTVATLHLYGGGGTNGGRMYFYNGSGGSGATNIGIQIRNGSLYIEDNSAFAGITMVGSSGNVTIGGTLKSNGDLTVGNNDGAASLHIGGYSGNNSNIDFRDQSGLTYSFRDENSGNLVIQRGSGRTAMLTFTSAGLATFAQNLTVSANTFVNRSYVGDGTLGSPSYSFTSEGATGMYLRAADSIALVTAGTTGLYLDASANVWMPLSLIVTGDITSGSGTSYNAAYTSLDMITKYGTNARAYFQGTATAALVLCDTSAGVDMKLFFINQGFTTNHVRFGVGEDGTSAVANTFFLFDLANSEIDVESKLNITYTMGSSTVDPATHTGVDDWLEIDVNGTTRYAPLYAAS